MRRFILIMMWLAMLGLAVADEPKIDLDNAEAVARALKAFSGTWEIVIVTPEAATKNARRLVFNADGTYAAQDETGKELWAGTFEIDASTTPMSWNHRSHDAKKVGTDVLGIYCLNGDELKVACVVGRWSGNEWIGKARPKALSLREADVVIELKRVKSSK